MLTCSALHQIFERYGIRYFTGVPDSTFESWITYVASPHETLLHRPASNEGAAIAHAAGYHLATGRLPVVYLQNSGLGNCVNPLTSLADEHVYGIPMLLMIGWRGEPGQPDEPQHAKMGRVTARVLDALDVPYELLDTDTVEAQIGRLSELAFTQSRPVALIVRRGSFEPAGEGTAAAETQLPSREEAVKTVADTLDDRAVVVSSTGKMSRELYEYRDAKGQSHERDFYMVGSMGHASAVALELALQAPERSVCILDGDGALIMHMGTLATIGERSPRNLLHIVLDNASHESTGGQPTVSGTVDIAAVARSCGYRSATTCRTLDELKPILNQSVEGPTMVVVKVRQGSRSNLGRPKTDPKDNKQAFMRNLTSRC